jgi:intracellular multiplication protein IcmE
MATDSKNFMKQNLSDKKSRFMLFFILIMIIIISVFFIFFSGSEEENRSSLKGAPKNNDTILIDNLNPAYEAELKEADRQRIEDAETTGKSATPTLIGTSSDNLNTLNLSEPEEEVVIVRPELSQVQPVAPVVIPEPVVETEIVRPNIIPIITRPDTRNQETQNAPEVRLVERQEPVTNQFLLQAYSREMASIISNMDQPSGLPATTYFYTPPLEDNTINGADVSIPAGVAGEDIRLTGASVSEVSATDGVGVNDVTTSSGEIPVSLPLAGNILYAQMVTTANSDAPGPVVAEILQGDLAGSRIIGSFSVANEKLVLQFSSISVDETMSGEKINKTFPINAVAVDTKYAGTAVASSVNRRLFQRIAVTFATAFIRGLGDAIASSGTTSETNDNGTTTTSTPEYDTEDQVRIAAGAGASEVGSIFQEYYGNRGITVKMEAGVPIGVLMLN